MSLKKLISPQCFPYNSVKSSTYATNAHTHTMALTEISPETESPLACYEELTRVSNW